MDVDAFLTAIRAAPDYRDQIVHVHVDSPRAAEYAADWSGLGEETIARLRAIGVDRLYAHQAEAVRRGSRRTRRARRHRHGRGKTLCYVLPVLELLPRRPREARALLLFPDQGALPGPVPELRARCWRRAGLADRLAGVFDGDTPAAPAPQAARPRRP